VRESDLGHAVQRREHQSQRVLNLWNLKGKHSKASRAALDHTGRGVPIGTGTAPAPHRIGADSAPWAVSTAAAAAERQRCSNKSAQIITTTCQMQRTKENGRAPGA
jgi:hypothetical protein